MIDIHGLQSCGQKDLIFDPLAPWCQIWLASKLREMAQKVFERFFQNFVTYNKNIAKNFIFKATSDKSDESKANL